MDNQKIASDHLPIRNYPPFEIIGMKRHVKLGNRTAILPKSWAYDQYLIAGLLPNILGKDYLLDTSNKTVLRNLYMEYIKRYAFGPPTEPLLANNSNMYLLSLASDMETLMTHNSLPDKLIKRIQSRNDGEMRGAIYELTVAAGMLRSGYKIKWINSDSSPEFSATKENDIDIEAKRRNRSANTGAFNAEKEVHLIKKNLIRALDKKRSNQYIIFIDTDMPPASSNEYKQMYTALVEELDKFDLTNTALIITNWGYEYSRTDTSYTKTSTLLFRGKNAPSKETIDNIVMHMHAALPPVISTRWTIS